MCAILNQSLRKLLDIILEYLKNYFDYVSKDYSKKCDKGIGILKLYGLFYSTSLFLIIDYNGSIKCSRYMRFFQIPVAW